MEGQCLSKVYKLDVEDMQKHSTPMRKNLQKKIQNINMICPCCGEEEESIEAEKGPREGPSRSCDGRGRRRRGGRERSGLGEGGRPEVAVRGNHWRPQCWQVCAD